MKRKFSNLILIPIIFISFQISYAQESLVGTFYGGWARNHGDYVWIKDLGKEARFFAVGDVNGDGYEDAIIASRGKFEVALSESYTNPAGREVRHFGEKATWAGRFGAGKGNYVNVGTYMVGDLNGDFKTDIAMFSENSGTWEFAISQSSSFQSVPMTITEFGTNGSKPFFEDVNGDEKDDAVLFEAGTWKVRLNNGDSFEAPEIFITDFGSEISQAYIADVNGDSKGDAVIFEDGMVSVALSEESSFVKPSVWISDIAATQIMFGDADGDQKDDIILFHMRDDQGRYSGNWEIGSSDGKDSFRNPQLWCRDHGSGDHRGRITKTMPEAHIFLTGYTQASKDSGKGVSSIAVNTNYGYWQVMPPPVMLDDVTSSKYYNSWHTWNRATLSRVDDQYYGFDAELDSFAIADIIKNMADVQIDYILFDQTNNWNVLIKSYHLFANEIRKWNEIPGNRKVKYAICGKGWKPRGAIDIEESAQRSMEEFVNHPVYGSDDNYQYVDGKPLLVIYGGGERKDKLWDEYEGDKTFADQFTIKWMDGHLYPEGMDPENMGDWYGWALVNGTYENTEQMVVQPGFFNHASFASRFYEGIEGDRYRRLNWDKVLLNKPNKVTIISLVADHEQNDIYDMRIGDYPAEMGRTEHWSYPEMYWEMTRDYIKNYRMLRNGEIQHIAEYGRVEANTTELKIDFVTPFSEIPAVFVSIYGNTAEQKKTARLIDVQKGFFTVKLEGTEIADNINWMAVLPGNWETPNGMKMSAGETDNLNGIGKSNEKIFNSSPAVFTSEYPSGNWQWIAMETNKSRMWSGRFCSAMHLSENRKKTVEFQLPRYFYDRVLTLASCQSTEIQPLIKNTKNTGGKIVYQSEPANKDELLHIVSFDGGGGPLYGKRIDK